MGWFSKILSPISAVASALSPAAGLISGGLGLVGSLVSGKKQESAQKSANATNLELAERQNEFNKQWWHEANEYNSPENQMLRYQAAGLNPNLIYGSAVNSPVSAGRSADMSVMPTDGLARGIQSGFGSLSSGVLQAQQLELQRKSVEADIKLKDSAARKNNVDADYAGANLDILNQTRDERIRKVGLENDEIANRIDLNKSVIDLNGVKYDLTNQQIANLKVNKKLLEQQLGLNDQKSAQMALEFERLKVDVFMRYLEYDHYDEYLKLRNQGMYITNAHTAADTQRIVEQTKSIVFNNKDLEAKWNWFTQVSDIYFDNETSKLLNDARANQSYETLDAYTNIGSFTKTFGRILTNIVPLLNAIKF